MYVYHDKKQIVHFFDNLMNLPVLSGFEEGFQVLSTMLSTAHVGDSESYEMKMGCW